MTLNSINNDQYTKDYEAVQKKGWRKKPVFTPTWRKRWREGVAKTLRNFLKNVH